MEFDWIWKAVLIIALGSLLLRLAGRKSISQMTLTQTVLMIAIGSLLIQPVSGKNIWITFAVSAVLILTLIVMEFIQLKSDAFETFITGKSAILIENGQLNEKNLKRYRLTVDLLEMMLRQQNINKISDVEWATIEPNGKLGCLLKPDAQPVTKADMKLLIEEVQKLDPSFKQQPPQNKKEDIFKEVADKKHQTAIPKKLQ
ncbi:DUF421 domain-containing protein [Gracilibacillus salinarum]|uniref:DUF421 domain-containing protein n=1 Tax=Gracilibacillus salinarum TaxID=2932255 RepID=A0ABY4GM04_9BACI|nr:DUF421 domain-containing protein [Gracilibacillus salinarum]UOQ85405.1 DUF421 domain-containing protein [Gracilibacillus salinarum]